MFLALVFATIDLSIGEALEIPVVKGAEAKPGTWNDQWREFYSLAEITFCQGEHKGSLRKAIDWGSIP